MKTRILFAVAVALLAIPHFVIAVVVDLPPIHIVGVLLLAFAGLAFAIDRWWAIVPGLVLACIVTAHIFLFYTAFTRFDSGGEFGSAISTVVLGASAVALGVSDLVARRRRTANVVSPVVVRAFATGVATVAVVAAASGVFTLAQRETVSAEDRADALAVDYKNTDVVNGTDSLKAQAGDVRIVVDNKDLGFHNFVIKEASISVDLGPKESKLVVADLEPGTYVFKCTISGHGAMTGTLTVQ